MPGTCPLAGLMDGCPGTAPWLARCMMSRDLSPGRLVKRVRRNYDGDHRPAMAGTTAGRSKVSCLTLRSSDIALETNYMVGMEQAGRLVLLPLDRAVQMRPHNAYLDRSQEGERAEASGAAAAARPKRRHDGGEMRCMRACVRACAAKRALRSVRSFVH